MQRDYAEDFEVALIEDDEPDRVPNEDAVGRLAESIQRVGLGAPLLVRVAGEGPGKQYKRISGWHRIQALRRLGKEFVPTILIQCTDAEARMLTITENLHRAELSAMERDDQIAEWLRMREAEIAAEAEAGAEGYRDHNGHGSKGRFDGYEKQAADDLGLHRSQARRAKATAGLSAEAKTAARGLGLADNQKALLDAAKHDTPEAQVQSLQDFLQAKGRRAEERRASAQRPPARPKADGGAGMTDAAMKKEAADELHDWWRKWGDEEFAIEALERLLAQARGVEETQ